MQILSDGAQVNALQTTAWPRLPGKIRGGFSRYSCSLLSPPSWSTPPGPHSKASTTSGDRTYPRSTRPNSLVLLLAITDQFEEGLELGKAADIVRKIRDEYEPAYYSGIICERQGRAHFKRGHYGSGAITYECLTQAMHWYEQAEALRRPNNDDALLRWNTCARFLMDHPGVQPEPRVRTEPILSE